MSHKRVKNLAADDFDDDYDDYDEEEDADALTEDDKAQLQAGAAEVRIALGPDFQTTDTEIQEALWHYYYDVGKVVTYLKNKRKPPTAGKSKKSEAHEGPVACMARFSAKDFFSDCPWLNIPPDQKVNILVEPLYPRMGLLGGSEGKVSKLAALAAKRRLKENEKPVSEHRSTAKAEQSPVEGTSAIKSQRIFTPSETSRPERKRPRPNPDITGPDNQTAVPLPLDKTPTSDQRLLVPDLEEPDPTITKAVESVEVLRASPSAFASTMTDRNTESLGSALAALVLEEPNINTFDFTTPSPDEVVTRAQHKGSSNTNKPPPRQNVPTKTTTDVATAGIKNLTIEVPRIKSKNLDVLSEYNKVKKKAAANFVVIGHVDAGKSTLMGRLLYDLKAIDQRTIDKYKKEAESIGKGSFAFAWVLDQGSEERARGVTIDIAMNKFETEQTSFTILDAPGHRDFVPNMIAGASQADFAVLVIDASPGNFESGLKGQTKEHALLVRSMGVQKIIVAINKMDAANWSEERFQEIQQQMTGFLATAGFQAKNTSFIPCSGLQGHNILKRSTESPWYTGHTLIEELDTSEPAIHAMDRALRMTIGDVFRGSIQNPVSISGRIEAGSLQIGDQVLTMPSGEKASIKSLEVDDEPMEWAVAGQNVVLNLTDIDPIHLKIGDMLCSPASPIQNVASFTAKVLAFEHLTPMTVDIHKGRLYETGRISQLVSILDKSDGSSVSKKKPKIVQPGSLVRVVVEMDRAVALEGGRIVLRANGETVAAGLIE